MSKNWLLPVLITNCLFAECLLGQDEAAVALPRDPRAAIAALPIMTPVVVTVHPGALGKCQLTITLGMPYRRELSKDVRRAVRGALKLQGVTFELTGTLKPTKKKVIKLDQQVIADIKSCLDDVRELLKQDGK